MRNDRWVQGLGDPQSPYGGLTEVMKQQMIAAAPNMTDGQAQDLQEIVDATNYGNRTKWTRYGLGAVVGIVVGLVVGKKLKG